jgi:hypothetical protein
MHILDYQGGKHVSYKKSRAGVECRLWRSVGRKERTPEGMSRVRRRSTEHRETEVTSRHNP